MLREMSAAFIGVYVLVLIMGLYCLSRGEQSYESFVAAGQGPAAMIFAVVAFAFAFYHTYTWFQVTPKAMPLSFAGKRVPGAFIIAAHWFGFIVASVGLWLLLWNWQ
jgi:fumarate reductase subunit C